MPKQSGTGVSRSVRLVVGGSVRRHTRATSSNLRPLALSQERKQRQERYELNVAGLGKQSQAALADIQHEQLDQVYDDMPMTTRDDLEWETVPDELKEDDAFVFAVRDIVGSQWRAYRDARTWRQRVDRVHSNWTPLMQDLVAAYIRWKYTATERSSQSSSSPTSYDFDIQCIDIYTLNTSAHISRSAESKSQAEALVLNGFLGSTPYSPSIAISLRTLELYHRIRLRKPSFSADAFTKVLCDLYNMPYRRRYRIAIAGAFDAYSVILRHLEQQIHDILGRNSPDWHVLNACPACSFEVDGEPPLLHSRLIALDGNNSLSRMVPLAGRAVGDTREFASNYFLPRDYVDRFANEVRSGADAEDDDTAGKKPCTKNWKAAADETKKKSWGIFDETGIFACACRHGFILWITDMIRSGELFKHPLAIVNKAIDVFGSRLLIAYDVGCKLTATIKSSSLATKFEASHWQSRMCVDSFHGYTHDYACQDKNHPNVIDGAGLEDFAMMERIFSASNQLAPVIRYATAYNRHLFIDMFFKQWDEEKYSNLGNMLYNNYRQALDVIQTDGVALASAKHSLGIMDADIKTWCTEQSHYLASLGKESEWDVHAMAYVELLEKMRDARKASENASLLFLHSVPTDYQFATPWMTSTDSGYATQQSHTRRLETQRRVAMERLNTFSEEAAALEAKMGLTRRWEPADKEYTETIKYMTRRRYQRALDELQRLVVLRLFELHKLNLSQTGYKLRTHIAKALQTRCKAIQNKVKEYNAAAQDLTPPAPTLNWSQVSHYGFLTEFTLLRETRQDVQQKPWARPEIREVMRQSRRLERAHEEIIRCNVELRRLHSAIVSENSQLQGILTGLRDKDHPLCTNAVEEFIVRRTRINSHVLGRVYQTFELQGFSGDKSVGIKRTVVPMDSSGVTINREVPVVCDEDDDIVSDEEDESSGTTVGGLLDYISDLPLRPISDSY